MDHGTGMEPSHHSSGQKHHWEAVVLALTRLAPRHGRADAERLPAHRRAWLQNQPKKGPGGLVPPEPPAAGPASTPAGPAWGDGDGGGGERAWRGWLGGWWSRGCQPYGAENAVWLRVSL